MWINKINKIDKKKSLVKNKINKYLTTFHPDKLGLRK